jgi:type II secretory pathway pseudopilin PulG
MGNRFTPQRDHAYTLTEVIIGMSLFIMISLGLISMTFQVRSTSEESVYQNMTLVLGQAYIEQIRSIDFARLSDVALGTAGSNTLVLFNTAGNVITNEANGPLVNGNWARETVWLDENEAGEPRQPMVFRFRPVLTDLASTTAGSAAGVEITVFFETTYNYGVERTFRSSFRSVRSDAPTY